MIPGTKCWTTHEIPCPVLTLASAATTWRASPVLTVPSLCLFSWSFTACFGGPGGGGGREHNGSCTLDLWWSSSVGVLLLMEHTASMGVGWGAEKGAARKEQDTHIASQISQSNPSDQGGEGCDSQKATHSSYSHTLWILSPSLQGTMLASLPAPGVKATFRLVPHNVLRPAFLG